MNIKHKAFVAAIIVSTLAAQAKEFGVIGQTWKIKEQDAIEVINGKLLSMEKTGALAQHNQMVKDRVEAQIKSPTSLQLPAATKERTFTYDPSIVVQEDLKDARGVIFQHKGAVVNPLDTVSMPYQLVFFDAEDKKQLEYALQSHSNAAIKPKLILTGGSPINIEQEYGVDVYFDQQGVLIKQLGIKAVPAIVSQNDKRLHVNEVRLD
jgi:conjugal transfer pilus assembly protein TraW